MNPRDVGDPAANAWDVAELKMQRLGRSSTPYRFGYLVYYRAKKISEQE
jgi:hypothetical protein